MAMPDLKMVSMDFPISSSPFQMTEPEAAFTRPVMVRRVVDFPAPLAPISVTISPSCTSRLMPRRALIPP